MANVLVVHGGGPTAVINASLYGVIQEAAECGGIEHVYGAIGGSEAILKERFLDLAAYPEEKLKLLLTTPATALGSSRYALEQEDYEATEPWIPAGRFTGPVRMQGSAWWGFPRP